MADNNNERQVIELDLHKGTDGIPYWVGAVLLGLLNTAVFLVSGKPWGITSAIASWGPGGLQAALPADGGAGQIFYRTILIGGLILGALAASLLHGEFRIRWPRQGRQYAAALLGGILMGYGARLANGCSIGALVGGIASGSLHGWIFGLFLFPGVWLGVKLAQKYFY